MSFTERSYSGEIFRPRPEVVCTEDNSLLIVATPWGARSAARKAAQFIQDFFLSARDDQEATSPFARLTCLSPLANQLRLTIKMANDQLYNEENKSEYLAACELTVMARTTSEVVIVQVGFPFVMLDRPTSGLTPLGQQMDLASELSLGSAPLAPLPNHLLGLDPTSDFAVRSFKPVPGDRFVLMSRSTIPPEVYALPFGRRSLDDIAKTLAQSDPRTPFWLGEFNIR